MYELRRLFIKHLTEGEAAAPYTAEGEPRFAYLNMSVILRRLDEAVAEQRRLKNDKRVSAI